MRAVDGKQEINLKWPYIVSNLLRLHIYGFYKVPFVTKNAYKLILQSIRHLVLAYVFSKLSIYIRKIFSNAIILCYYNGFACY